MTIPAIAVILSIGYVWLVLINDLRIEWWTDPQYAYGLLVPLLCIGLLFRRLTALPVSTGPQAVPVRVICIGAAALALLYLPTRLIEASTPEWRPIQWLLGMEAVGLTLSAITLAKGRHFLRQVLFPICFFLVAIPWPTPIEAPITQILTRLGALVVTDLLGWMGVPAITHGNIIEISSGLIGIDEACSGIRSFHTSLMIGLFLGEFYRLAWLRRGALLVIGFAFSMALNMGRMLALTLVAHFQGIEAVPKFHDTIGVVAAIACPLSIWGLTIILQRRTTPSQDQPESAKPETGRTHPETRMAVSQFRWLGLALAIWVATAEAGVQLWYSARESQLQRGPGWTIDLPNDNSSLRTTQISAATYQLLRFDDGKQASWMEPNGIRWQLFYFDWAPGRVAGYLAKRHTPEICLPAVGLHLLSGPHLFMMNIYGIALPVKAYVFTGSDGVFQVFHCRWEDGVPPDSYTEDESSRMNLIRGIWNGRGKNGQKVLEFVGSGFDSPEQAKLALEQELKNLIQVSKPGKPAEAKMSQF